MNYDKQDIFSMMYDTFKITKPIKLIELFSGYGSQALALKYLGADFKHHKIVEWAIPSIIAYADLHRNELEYYGEDMCSDLTKEQICNELFKYGVSKDYNKPATLEELKRMNEDKLRLCFNCIQWTNNLVDISRVKGSDLNIQNDGYDYIMTYSFPCQDLSVVGNRKGMGEGTRSGLLWQVERILTECEIKPQVLLMENVIQVHSEKDMIHFRKWINRLEELGYQNYWQDLIATDYGIPQTRNRCFMVSILGNYSYTFPKPMKLQLRLKDLLEKNVSEEYFLSDTQINNMQNSTFTQNQKRLQENELCDTFLAIKNNNAKGYLEATDGDGVDISGRMQYHRGTVQKGMAQTLNTNQDGGVVVKNESLLLGGIGEKDSNSGTQWKQQNRIYSSEKSGISLGTGFNPFYNQELRIRKLTEKECFRLMGLKDEDIRLVSEHQSKALCYHLAGDSLVSTIMIALISQMLDKNWVEYFNPKEWWKNE